MANPLMLVTGATGTVGSELVPQLLESNVRVRVLSRDLDKAKKFGKGVEVVKGDLEKPETLAPAFAGVEKGLCYPPVHSLPSWKATLTSRQRKRASATS